MDEKNRSPQGRVEAAMKITAEFEQALSAIQAEYNGLIKKTLAEKETGAISRLHEAVKKFYEKLTSGI
jgi:hypothetical protein